MIMPLVKYIAETVQTKLSAIDGASVALDVASGSGEPALSIAKDLPRCDVVATDIAPGMIVEALRRAQENGVRNFRCAARRLSAALTQWRTPTSSRAECLFE